MTRTDTRSTEFHLNDQEIRQALAAFVRARHSDSDFAGRCHVTVSADPKYHDGEVFKAVVLFSTSVESSSPTEPVQGG